MSMFNPLDVSRNSAEGPSLPSPYRSLSLKTSSSSSVLGVSVLRQGGSLLANRGFRLADRNPGRWNIGHAKNGSSFRPPLPNIPKANLPFWVKCIVGVILSLIQPFWKLNGGKLLTFERQVEMFVEKVEDVAEVVEEVAEVMEKAAADAAEKLPENSFLKNAVKFVGEISKEVGDDAEDTQDFIKKIDEVMDEVETIVEDLIHGEWGTKEGETITEAMKDKKTLELEIDVGKVKEIVHETLSEVKINYNEKELTKMSNRSN